MSSPETRRCTVNSGKFLSRCKFLCWIAASAFGLLAMTAPHNAASAQTPGYRPPPMFEDMTPPMVRPETKDGYIVQPKASVAPRDTQSPVPPAYAKPPVVLPRVSVDPDAQKQAPLPIQQAPVAPAPVPANVPPAKPVAPPVAVPPPAPVVTQPQTAPAQKPSVTPSQPPVVQPPKMKPIVEEVYIKREKPKAEKKEVSKPVPPKKPAAPKEEERTQSQAEPSSVEAASPPSASAPVPRPPEEAPKPVEPAQRDPSESAIHGPKTMPALPTQSVDGQVLYEGQEAASSEPTILERHQQQAEQKSEPVKPVVPRPKEGVAPASFDKAERQNALKKTIPFQPGQIGLKTEEADPIAAGVVKELDDDERKDWRVQIKSFATPSGTGLNSDRRVALSRALSLRSTLITQGVPAGSIDVLAEGGQEDRIDIYLYGPAGE
jgi:outer membrane protein OmpA-like peptidoglycan-associated protein